MSTPAAADPIVRFDGPYRFLSNFAPSPIRLLSEDWPTGEHAFQGLKTIDPILRDHVRRAPSPERAKRYGRAVPLRDGWEMIKSDVMLLVVRAKFTQNADLAANLLATGTAHLEEGNDWGDQTWGTVNGVGENRLGKILMAVRTELVTVSAHRPAAYDARR